MKRILLVALAVIICSSCFAGPKQEARMKYIFKEMKFDKPTQEKMKGLVMTFLMDLKNNKDKHDELKDKYKDAEASGKLTATQAEELMASKFRKDQKELDIRKMYYTKFKNLLGAVKARKILALANDKLKD